MYVDERGFVTCMWMRKGSSYVCGLEKVPHMYVDERGFLSCMLVREGP